MKSSRILTTLTAIVISIATVGCQSDKASPTGPETNGSNGGSNAQKLSFFEEQLVGTWYRYHSYDGSSRYVKFNADRTACKWEEPNGSNRRINVRSYPEWHIDESTMTSGHVMKVIVSNAGIDYTFDYPSDVMWPGSHKTLKHFPNSEGKTCQ